MKSQLLVAGAILQSSLVLADASAVKTSSVSGFFVEQFQDGDWENKWSPSEATKEGYGGGETMQYSGVWNVEEPTVYPGLKGDKGLVVKSTATHHAISVPFASKLDPKGKKSFVVQYEVKLQKGLDCGGAYIKLLTDGEEGIQAKEFSDKTPYTVMFGPDKCGGTQKVHLIIRHQNPLTGEFQEKHLKNPPMPKTDKLTNLYTLIINDDQTYEIKINDESAKSGSLLEDFQPPFNPPKEIDDPEDSKPEDWIDNPKMVDPDAVKPDDWDEDAPMEIPDEEAEKPEGWLDNEPATIPDPDAEKPEEWDDDEDGDWIAPS
ncbi:Calreticulin/calnexin, partial [Atractiella rhizophila]